jgi:hypothetical protein
VVEPDDGEELKSDSSDEEETGAAGAAGGEERVRADGLEDDGFVVGELSDDGESYEDSRYQRVVMSNGKLRTVLKAQLVGPVFDLQQRTQAEQHKYKELLHYQVHKLGEFTMSA